MSDSNEKQTVHDINSSLQALQGALELIKDEWRTNPQLVERLLPLTVDKLNQLQSQLQDFRHLKS